MIYWTQCQSSIIGYTGAKIAVSMLVAIQVLN